MPGFHGSLAIRSPRSKWLRLPLHLLVFVLSLNSLSYWRLELQPKKWLPTAITIPITPPPDKKKNPKSCNWSVSFFLHSPDDDASQSNDQVFIDSWTFCNWRWWLQDGPYLLWRHVKCLSGHPARVNTSFAPAWRAFQEVWCVWPGYSLAFRYSWRWRRDELTGIVHTFTNWICCAK